MKAYYFSTLDKKLQYDDGRVIRKGRTHKVNGDIILCENGLHGSKRIIDALQYAPGPYLWEVELSGAIVKGKDKCCASERTYIRGFNAEKLLREFARKQALIKIKKIKPYTNEYDLIVEYLETGEKASRSAARFAAEAVAWFTRSTAKAAAAECMLQEMVEAEFNRQQKEA